MFYNSLVKESNSCYFSNSNGAIQSQVLFTVEITAEEVQRTCYEASLLYNLQSPHVVSRNDLLKFLQNHPPTCMKDYARNPSAGPFPVPCQFYCVSPIPMTCRCASTESPCSHRPSAWFLSSALMGPSLTSFTRLRRLNCKSQSRPQELRNLQVCRVVLTA